TNLASAVGADRLGERVGISQALGSQSLSGLLGLIVYVLILVPVLIASLNALQIEAITAPASEMLNTFLTALPNIFAAALVLTIAYFVARIIAGLVTNLVRGLGFDRLMARLGVTTPGAAQSARITAETPEARQAAATAGASTPSDWLGTFVLVGIMLFATIAALNLLGFVALTALVTEFTVLIGRILLGLVIFAVGLFLANTAARAIVGSNVGQAGLLALTARVAIIALAGAMALRQMGLANEIINLAFGLTLGALAVAFALAFGLGAREVAGREAERMFEAIRNRSANARAMGAEKRMEQQTPPRNPNPGRAPGD
ncbi:MAG TPA: mechanosensitive ion channel, partial [Chloroflexaceae bacterium]|nr:mechanosensitive ion channel [Chloroflexaceae bacterium]